MRKNLLFIAYESELGCCLELYKKFKLDNNNCFIISVDHYYFTHNFEKRNEVIKKYNIGNKEYYNLEEVYQNINVKREQIPDINFLRDFEKKYLYPDCETINNLIYSDPILSNYHHFRRYYQLPSNNQTFWSFIVHIIKLCLEVIDNSSPDLIFTISNQYFCKRILYQIAKAKKIPFLTLHLARINDLAIISDTFGLGPSREIQAFLTKNGSHPRVYNSANDIEYTENFLVEQRSTAEYSYKIMHEDIRLIKKKMGYFERLKKFAKLGDPRTYLSWFRAKKYSRWWQRDLFLPNIVSYYWIQLLSTYHQVLFHFNIKCINTLPNINYVYYTMHLMPESSILSVSKKQNEIDCIEELSRSLPIDWIVIVKPHLAMFWNEDYYPIGFYQKIKKLKNVKIMTPYFPTKILLDNAKIVASVAGTSLLEASIRGIPGIRWGNPEFTCLDSIYPFSSENIQLLTQRRQSEKNNIFDYVYLVKNTGLECNWNKLHNLDAVISGELDNFTDKLVNKINLYLRAE